MNIEKRLNDLGIIDESKIFEEKILNNPEVSDDELLELYSTINED